MCTYYVGCVYTCHSPCVGVIGQFVGHCSPGFMWVLGIKLRLLGSSLQTAVPFSTRPDHRSEKERPLFLFHMYLFLFHEDGSACMYVPTPHVCLLTEESRRGHQILWNWVMEIQSRSQALSYDCSPRKISTTAWWGGVCSCTQQGVLSMGPKSKIIHPYFMHIFSWK